MPTKIWLIRHGETQSNLDRVFQGHLDTPLTERGYQQARAVGAALKGVDFDAVYSSDLTRAAETARSIVPNRNDVVLDERLRELNYGVLQGVAIDRFRDVLAVHGVAESWGPGVFSQNGMAPPEGESISDLRQRLENFTSDLFAAHPGEREQQVLLVAHGGTLRVLMTLLLDLPVERRAIFSFANCAVSRISRIDEESLLDLHNAVYWSD